MAVLFPPSRLPQSLLPLLLFIVAIVATTAQFPIHYCPDSVANDTANTTFQSNLGRLLAVLAANGSSAGFLNAITGDLPDRAYGLVLCRGDVAPGTCGSCLATATEGVVQACPYKKSAVIWYDLCMLRYSNQLFFSVADSNVRVIMINTQDQLESSQFNFNQQMWTMMSGLVRYAAYNASARMFATGAAEYEDPAAPRIYALVQCTRDLSTNDCARCLEVITVDMMDKYSGRRGARTLTSSCSMRYELYAFYNSSEMVSVPLPANATPPVAAGLFPPTTVPDGAGEKKKSGVGTALAAAIPVVAVLVLICVICICLRRRKAYKKIRYTTTNTHTEEFTAIESLLFDLSTLQVATGNFSDINKLGQGGFGEVYKGFLPNGQEIAVKRVSRGSSQGVEQLRNEVTLLAKLQHRNLVRLLGACLGGEEMLLVYEFVPNRSLDTFLFDPMKSLQLHWEIRYKIIEGIARGLQYLHEDSQHKIIHRDLKASNILLSLDMKPKISDFGLARLFGGDQTQASTIRIAGTYGYMAPEYAMRGHFSNKSDVFSFGVLVLEIVTGRKSTNFFNSERSVDLLSAVWEHWTNGRVLDTIDPSLGGRYQQSEVLRCVQLGLLCVQGAPASRPTMSSVVLILSSHSVSLQVPSQPAFFLGNSEYHSDVLNTNLDSSASTHEGSNSKSVLYSQNEVSVTEL